MPCKGRSMIKYFYFCPYRASQLCSILPRALPRAK
nr:MAG TPA: hypothetical protein [Caudoviricetes sp.]